MAGLMAAIELLPADVSTYIGGSAETYLQVLGIGGELI